MFHSVSGALHSKQPMKEGEKKPIPYALDVHMQDFFGQILLKKTCWFERNKKKNPLHPCLFTPVCFMDVYVYM